MSAVGAAALVAGGMFSVSAFAETDELNPRQAASEASVPEQPEEQAEDFFAASPDSDEAERDNQREATRDEVQAAADEAVQAASGTGAEIQEPEPEPEPEAEETPSGGSSDESSGAASVPSGSAKDIALQMVLDEGWGADEFHSCLEPLWEKESNWDHTAENPSSGAYGIPQSLPGNKMASEGDDWQTNPATQIAWGLSYIKDRYGNPCGAWSHSQANNWY